MKKISLLIWLTLTTGPIAWSTPESPKHGIVMELWENIKTGKVSELVNASQKQKPHAIYVCNKIDQPASGKDNFGIRFSALLRAPENGEYTFYLAADDAAELWISSDKGRDNLKKVSATRRYTAKHHFQPGPASGKMKLEKDKQYYLEVLYKEAINDDHVALAWEGPGIKKQVISEKYFTPELTPAQLKIWEQTTIRENQEKELLNNLKNQDADTLATWLEKLPNPKRQLLDQALQKTQAELTGRKPDSYKKGMLPYLRLAAGIKASPETPVNHPVAKRLLQMEETWLKTLTNQQLIKLGPHRLSASLGKIPESAKTVTVTRKLNSHGDKWMQESLSTGMYAAPGKPVTVTIPENLADKNLEIQVGHHFAEKNKPLISMPGTSRWFKLTKASTTFVTPHGGLILLRVPQKQELKDTEITIEGAIRAPRFVLGENTNEDWARMKKAPAPWGELVCEHLVLIVPREALLQLNNPTELMTWWNENNRDMEEFYSYFPKLPFRMHSGYYAEEGLSYWPLQWGTKSIERLLKLDIMKSHNAALYLHEHGHHCDCWEMELSFWAEATPNWGGYYLKARKGKEFTWKATHDTHLRNLFEPDNKGMLEIMQDKWYKINTKGTHHWSYPITSMMIGYAEDFGWDCIKTTIKRMRDKKGEMYNWDFVQGADDDQAKIDRYLIGLSEAAKRDVRPYFAHFKMFPSDGAAKHLDNLKLPKWDLTYLALPEIRQTAKNTPMYIACGKKDLLSFAKKSSISWKSTTAKGGKVKRQRNGTAVFIPADNFTGVDTLSYRLSNEYGRTVEKQLKITVE